MTYFGWLDYVFMGIYVLILVGMGHDCMPVGSNTSIINYDGTPKPAYHAVKELFLE